MRARTSTLRSTHTKSRAPPQPLFPSPSSPCISASSRFSTTASSSGCAAGRLKLTNACSPNRIDSRFAIALPGESPSPPISADATGTSSMCVFIATSRLAKLACGPPTHTMQLPFMRRICTHTRTSCTTSWYVCSRICEAASPPPTVIPAIAASILTPERRADTPTRGCVNPCSLCLSVSLCERLFCPSRRYCSFSCFLSAVT
mmetsp:Transcript_1020/g.2373  ORF Transcript_1020/g.2373 Transcript_1020/m.2373 type:complete len:203 (+) Transcript_1020:287-895(+)